jgi:hypothetical protein
LGARRGSAGILDVDRDLRGAQRVAGGVVLR